MPTRASLAVSSLAALTFGFAIACSSSIPIEEEDTGTADVVTGSSSSSSSSSGESSTSSTGGPVGTSSGFPEEDGGASSGTTSSGSTSSSGGDGGQPACAGLAEVEANNTAETATAGGTFVQSGAKFTLTLCGVSKTGDTDFFKFTLPDDATSIETRANWTVGNQNSLVTTITAEGQGRNESGTLFSPPFIRGGAYTLSVVSNTSTSNAYTLQISVTK